MPSGPDVPPSSPNPGAHTTRLGKRAAIAATSAWRREQDISTRRYEAAAPVVYAPNG